MRLAGSPKTPGMCGMQICLLNPISYVYPETNQDPGEGVASTHSHACFCTRVMT